MYVIIKKNSLITFNVYFSSSTVSCLLLRKIEIMQKYHNDDDGWDKKMEKSIGIIVY